MAPEIPRKDELQERAVDGHPITKDEVSSIAQEETDLTGRGPIKGGAAATAQSIQAKQQNYVEAAGDASRKPTEEITKEDATEVQKAEARAMGGQPGKGSTAANLQSAADKNANLS